MKRGSTEDQKMIKVMSMYPSKSPYIDTVMLIIRLVYDKSVIIVTGLICL